MACRVNELDFYDQVFEDVVLAQGDTMELPFMQFEQIPLCNYTSWYTVTLYEKGHPDLVDIPFMLAEEG